MGKAPNFDAVVVASEVAEKCQAFRLGEQGSHLQGIAADGWLSCVLDEAPAANTRELT